jgi:TatD DNase family protein
MLVDSHCHLEMLPNPVQGDYRAYLQQAEAMGVTTFLSVSVELKTFPDVLRGAEQFPCVYASVGAHPCELEDSPAVDRLLTHAQHPKVVAVGETGLDYFHIKEAGDITTQQQQFRNHIRAARELQKPLIIHMRDATLDTLRILREERAQEVGGVMHCYTEDWDTAQAAMDLGFLISFSGIVTFKSATVLRDVALRMPLDQMLVETDCPYLAPVPHRGKPNQPAYVRHVAEFIAQLRELPFETVAQQTTQNFARLFRVAP